MGAQLPFSGHADSALPNGRTASGIAKGAPPILNPYETVYLLRADLSMARPWVVLPQSGG